MPLDPDLLRLYVVAAAVLMLIPGPDTLLVLTRSISQGRPAGLVATAGITFGNFIHTVAATAGVSALIAADPMLFDALRFAGASYLVWIGAKSLKEAAALWRRRRDGEAEASAEARREERRVRIFAQALLTNMLNVKVILFYLAFVPQFVSPDLGAVGLQTFLLGSLLALMGCLYFIGLAAFSAGMARAVFANTRIRAALDGAAGLLFLGFALRLFLTERKFA
jgi:threonine/homoserine/homoserine lactone efflux protein